MRGHNAALLTAAALVVLAAPPARADSGWSGAAHLGLAFAREQGAPVTSGAWLDLLHTLMPGASAGIEAGYLEVPLRPYYAFAPLDWLEYSGTENKSQGMVSASAAVKIRGRGPSSPHMIGTFGYYHRAEFPLPNYEWNPGFSLGVGFSGAGFVRPSFQLRWHEMIGPEGTNLDVLTFEVGAHFD